MQASEADLKPGELTRMLKAWSQGDASSGRRPRPDQAADQDVVPRRPPSGRTDRDAFLAEACSQDPSLLQELDALLA